MTIYMERKEINTKNDFQKFMEEIIFDFKNNKSSWENNNLKLFLEATLEYYRDIDGFYNNMNIKIDSEIPTWQLFADIITGAKYYE
ncbi:MAG: hypothetical protein A2086_17125 [Spirochaetes bacterium GWD1_27_9]|nr:MAG: hypothetical protein A2Z98_02585 [Spirochaetes bacterium GWB1_27_13]OHD27307.1 MAG: hypothetical protein A2Y34_15910 [Spirochaetes bacterium GWC1_27_15]OHD34169.1 MAG: hypothetical protein A2086_17125 [Spirochaetes bacterium GWD1_27_9]